MEIYGPEASGKTTLALHVIAEAQKQGGFCYMILYSLFPTASLIIIGKKCGFRGHLPYVITVVLSNFFCNFESVGGWASPCQNMISLYGGHFFLNLLLCRWLCISFKFLLLVDNK